MLFWVVAAALTLIASLAVLMPLMRGTNGIRSGLDVEVYRDQLVEVGRDLARGLIGPTEAEQAKAEIGRRILRIDAEAQRGEARKSTATPRRMAAIAVLAVPLASWALYTIYGSPSLPSQPLATRNETDPSQRSIRDLVAQAETHLAANPDDARGWEVLAPIYMRTGRYQDAVTAYRNAIRLSGATAQRQADLGEAIASAAGGVVNAEAEKTFEQALIQNKDNPKARYYLAMAMAQDGKKAEAVEALRLMQAGLPAGSPWRAPVDETIASLEQQPPAQPTPGASGPSAAEIEAAQSMSTEDRSAMIEQMVVGLDQKLREQPDDVEGWKRLVRSYAVLGKPEQARDALKRALAALGETSDKGRQISAFASSLNISATE